MAKNKFSRQGQEADFKIPDLFVKLDKEQQQEQARQVKPVGGGTIVTQGRVPKAGPPVIEDGRTVKDGRTVADGRITGDTPTVRDGRVTRDGRVRTDTELRTVRTAPVFQEAPRQQEFLITPDAELPRQHAVSSDQKIIQQALLFDSRAEIMRAFVLAEILGKPRALKGWEEERF